MKKTIPAFLAGVLVALLLCSFTAAANPIPNSGADIHIWPINGMVNGEIFQPKDVNGNDVLVFSYNGTTYAPLRALAEAYGLVVGYDAETYTATVTAPTPTPAPTPVPTEAPAFDADYSKWTEEQEIGYQEFKAMWTLFPSTNPDSSELWYSYNGTLTEPELKAHLNSIGQETIMAYGKRWIIEGGGKWGADLSLCYDTSCEGSINTADYDRATLIRLAYSTNLNQWITTKFNLI